MRKLLQLLRDDERGASLIEMALTVPFLATLVIGMTDISYGYSEKLQLEQAAQRAIEKAMNGDKKEDLYETLKAEAAAAAEVDESDVTVEWWLECSADGGVTWVKQAKYEDNCDDDEAYARYVNVEIEKVYDPMFTVKWLKGSNPDGTFTLHGEAGVRVQ